MMGAGDTSDWQSPSLCGWFSGTEKPRGGNKVRVDVALRGAVEVGRVDDGAVEPEGDAITEGEANGVGYAGVGGGDVLQRIASISGRDGRTRGREGKRTGACLVAGTAAAKLETAREEIRVDKMIIAK